MAELPTDEQLIDAVRGAGWLLEHQALRTLDTFGMHPRPGWAYQDPDEPTKSRELDMWSYRQFLKHDESRVRVSARFLVECKHSSLPYVGVGHELPHWRFNQNPTQHVLPHDYRSVPLPDGGRSRVTAWRYLGFEDLARSHGDSRFRVTQLTRLDRKNGGTWDANNSGVFTSLVYPLAKALRASQSQYRNPPTATKSPSGNDRRGWIDFGLHFPVVLISCPLYVVDASKTDVTVSERPWVTATRELKSKNTSGTFEFDIVTESAFAEYVQNRIAFADDIGGLVANDPLHFTGEDRNPT